MKNTKQSLSVLVHEIQLAHYNLGNDPSEQSPSDPRMGVAPTCNMLGQCPNGWHCIGGVGKACSPWLKSTGNIPSSEANRQYSSSQLYDYQSPSYNIDIFLFR